MLAGNIAQGGSKGTQGHTIRQTCADIDRKGKLHLHGNEGHILIGRLCFILV